MPETVADAAAFECLMKRRYDKYFMHDFNLTGYNIVIACTKDGHPFGKEAKRAFCEMEKLALGLSEMSFVVCDVVMTGKEQHNLVLKHHRGIMFAGVTKHTEYARKVTLWVGPDDKLFMDKLFLSVVRGIKLRPYDGQEAGYASPGIACAYPGGCD